MLETYGVEELRGLVGHEVIDATGDSVGYVDLVFVDDDSGRPEWLGIWNGVWATKPRVLVPIRGIEHVEDEIRLPWTKDVVQNAPRYDDEDDRGLFADDADAIGISVEKERMVYDHYGIEPITPRAEGHTDPRFRAWQTDVRASRSV
jgi:sporulation protein YlmC with PRC-barrel domain